MLIAQRAGLGGVLRRLTGQRLGGTPQTLLANYQPVLEARALRIWEDFDEGILLWSFWTTSGAVVAQFSFVQIALGAAPPGTLYTVDSIATDVVADVRTASAPIARVGIVRPADTRWSPGTGALPPNPEAAIGSNAVVTGGQFSRVIVPGLETTRYISDGLRAADNLTVWGTVLNAALTIALTGRLITRT